VIDFDAHGLIAPSSPPRDVGGPGTVAALLDDAVASAPDRIALVGRSGRFTMAELDAEVDRAAGALVGLGIGAGSRVAMSLPNDVDVVIGYLAAMRLGAIWLGINRPLAPPEKATCWETPRCRCCWPTTMWRLPSRGRAPSCRTSSVS
jgi:acyl-CoA synthetase (AMP-forming)/AMP-acid ligase II